MFIYVYIQITYTYLNLKKFKIFRISDQLGYILNINILAEEKFEFFMNKTVSAFKNPNYVFITIIPALVNTLVIETY